MDKFNLIKEFSKELTSTLELEELAKVINRFAVIELKAEHSSISIEGKGKYSYKEQGNVFDEIEKETLKYMMRVGKSLRIISPANEFIFKDIKGIESFSNSILVLPLITKNQVLGALSVYFPHLPEDEKMEFLTLFAELSSASIMNSLAYRTVSASSMTDKLTCLHNRRNFDVQVEKLIESCSSANIPSSVMMIDIDNFKEYNDTKGHQEGDMVLAGIGNTVKAILEDNCCAFRYGGEELAVIIPRAKPDQAFEIAEKVRKGIEETCKITVSIGIVTCLNSSCNPNKMVKEADACLYKAKKAGKNRTHSCVIIDKSMNPIDVQTASAVGKS